MHHIPLIWLFFFVLTDEVLLLLLLAHHLFLLLLLLHHHLLLFHLHLLAHHFLLLLSFHLSSLSFFLFLLLLFALFLCFSLFFFLTFHFCPLLLLSGLLSLRLSTSLGFIFSVTIVFLLGRLTLILLSTPSKNLSNERRGVNSSRGGTEHLLQPDICLLSLLTSQYHGWFDIYLFLHYHFGECDDLNQEVKFTFFVFETFGVELLTLEEAITKICLLHGGGENIMQISEGWFAKKLLGHLWFLEQLLVKLSL